MEEDEMHELPSRSGQAKSGKTSENWHDKGGTWNDPGRKYRRLTDEEIEDTPTWTIG